MALVWTSISGGAEPDWRAAASSRVFCRSAMDSVVWVGGAEVLLAMVERKVDFTLDGMENGHIRLSSHHPRRCSEYFARLKG